MRRLMPRRLTAGRDRGVTAVVFALAAPMIIGAVGLSVDSGNLVLQRANVQKASDNAALAIGQDCARATRALATAAQKQRCTDAGGLDTAQLMNNENAPGAVATIPGGVAPMSGTATVKDSKSVPMKFAATLGVQPKTVTGSSTVTWGQVPTAADTLPMSLDICQFNAWKNSPSSTPKLYRYDRDAPGPPSRSEQTDPITCPQQTGGSDKSINGALWLVENGNPSYDDSKCQVSTWLGNNTGKIFPNNWDFSANCTARANALVKNKAYLMIVGESDGWNGWGNGLWPRVRGYAPFVVTGWRLGDKNSVMSQNLDPSAPACTGQCRGLQGYFSGSVVQLDGATAFGVNPGADFGSIRVKLTG